MIGYIVTQGSRGALGLGTYDDGPKYGLLLSGDTAHLFKTRRAARRAIARTQRYSNKHRFGWESFGPSVIFRVITTREC